MTFQGSIVSHFAKLHLDSVVDDLNDETLDPWADLQAEAGIPDTSPLNPFMEKELLKDNDLSLDGTLLIRETGFQYVGFYLFDATRLLTFTDTSTRNSLKRKLKRL